MPSEVRSNFRFADLPHDVQLYLFQVAASFDQELALDLCLISRDVATVVRSVIFKTVVLAAVGQISEFLCMLGTADKAFLQRTVHNLFIADGVLDQFIRSSDAGLNALWSITQECKGIRRIVAPIEYVARLLDQVEDEEQAVIPSSCPNLTHLVLTRTRNLQIHPNFQAQFFCRIKRLYIQSHFYCFLPTAMVVTAESFPVLTHLAVLHVQFTDGDSSQSDVLLQERLSAALELPLLHRLLVCCSGMEPPDMLIVTLAKLRDPRIHVVMGFTTGDEVLQASLQGDYWWEGGIPVFYA